MAIKRILLSIVIMLILVFSVVIISSSFLPHKGSTQSAIANPASTFCEEQGYELKIRTMQDGSQQGICINQNGNECEEWAFYRKECSLE